MRILHFADLHLGVESYGCLDPTTGLSTRLLDVLKALDQVTSYAVENQVDLVLFCGDAYKSRDPSQTQQREFARRLKYLSEQGIPVFLLVGNHDLPHAVGRATTVEIFDTLAISNIYVAHRADIYHIPAREGYLQIAALPWPRRSLFLTKESTKSLTLEEINNRLQEIMTQKLLEFIPHLVPDLPCLLVAHVWIAGAKPGSERSMVMGREPVLLPSNIAHSIFDYVALGHIHKKQEIFKQPPVIYAGSLERLDFSDEGEEKGFYIVDIESSNGKKQVNYHFHQIDARRFVTIKVDISTEDSEPTATVLKAISQHQAEVKEAIVKVQISMPAAMETLIHDADLRKALKDAHYIAIAKETKTEHRSRLGDWVAEELTPLEALKVYLQTKKVSPEHQRILLQYGESLIEGSLSQANP